jgi:hypothetical protein
LGACGADGAVGGAFGNFSYAEGFAFFVEDVDAFGGDVEVAEGVACEAVAAFVEVVVSERSDPWLETLLSDYNAVMVGSDIKTLSAVERLQTMELLWWLFAGLDHEIPSPEWHGEVLSSRLAKVEAGEGRFLTIPEIKSRLASKAACGC